MKKKWLWLSFLIMFSNTIFAAGFPAGTLVKTTNGYSSIEDIQVGDLVVTCNLQDSCEEKEVLATNTEQTDSLVQIFVGDVEIKVSGDHLFYVPDEHRWVQAKNLGIGFELLTASHQILLISEVSLLQESQPQSLYDLSIADNHNFYVSDKDILVHNFGFALTLVAPFVPAVAPVVGGAIIATAVFHVIKGEIALSNLERDRRRAREEQEQRQARERKKREDRDRQARERAEHEHKEQESKLNSAVEKARKAIQDYLGDDYETITNKHDDKIFMSKDKNRKVRFDYKNPHGDRPHVHIEEKGPDGSWVDATDKHRIYFEGQ